jgi:hypothetical protein
LSFLLFLGVPAARAQVNISGKPGLIYVPSATLTEDGAFRLGVNYNPVEYGFRRRGRNAERILHASLTLLPRLEVNINFLQNISTDQSPIRDGIGDRQLDLRYVLLKETAKRPSVAVVMSSPFTIDAALLTHALVATKGFALGANLRATVSAGVGSPYFLYRDVGNLASYNVFEGYKWQKKSEYKYKNGYLEGPFGGVQLAYREKAGLLLEYDSQRVNVGAYAQLWKRWNIQAGLLNFRALTLGTAYTFPLLKTDKRIMNADRAAFRGADLRL